MILNETEAALCSQWNPTSISYFLLKNVEEIRQELENAKDLREKKDETLRGETTEKNLTKGRP